MHNQCGNAQSRNTHLPVRLVRNSVGTPQPMNVGKRHKGQGDVMAASQLNIIFNLCFLAEKNGFLLKRESAFNLLP